MAKIHANVVAIDPSISLIRTAKAHLYTYPLDGVVENELSKRIDYRTETIEEHNKKNCAKYDAVIISEVLEHIDNEFKEDFLRECINALAPGGSIFITTFNRTNFA